MQGAAFRRRRGERIWLTIRVHSAPLAGIGVDVVPGAVIVEAVMIRDGAMVGVHMGAVLARIAIDPLVTAIKLPEGGKSKCKY
jgi:hypothetical protein